MSRPGSYDPGPVCQLRADVLDITEHARWHKVPVFRPPNPTLCFLFLNELQTHIKAIALLSSFVPFQVFGMSCFGNSDLPYQLFMHASNYSRKTSNKFARDDILLEKQ